MKNLSKAQRYKNELKNKNIWPEEKHFLEQVKNKLIFYGWKPKKTTKYKSTVH